MDGKDYVLRYFELHAKQRMASFNFYILLSSIVGSGIVASFSKDFQFPEIRIPTGILLVIVSFVFWKLDNRVKTLIKIAESQLILLEENNKARVFSVESEVTTQKRA